MPRQVLLFTVWLLAALPVLVGAAPPAPWMTLGGTALNPAPTFFTLDYGKGQLRVDMGDWPWFRDSGNGLIGGRKVIVHGRLDENFDDKATLEATSIHVPDLGTRSHAGKTSPVPFNPRQPVRVGQVEVQGTISNTGGSEFSLGTGTERISVDTGALSDEQRHRLEKGDRVRVRGQMVRGRVDPLELRASTIEYRGP